MRIRVPAQGWRGIHEQRVLPQVPWPLVALPTLVRGKARVLALPRSLPQEDRPCESRQVAKREAALRSSPAFAIADAASGNWAACASRAQSDHGHRRVQAWSLPAPVPEPCWRQAQRVLPASPEAHQPRQWPCRGIQTSGRRHSACKPARCPARTPTRRRSSPEGPMLPIAQCAWGFSKPWLKTTRKPRLTCESRAFSKALMALSRSR